MLKYLWLFVYAYGYNKSATDAIAGNARKVRAGTARRVRAGSVRRLGAIP